VARLTGVGGRDSRRQAYRDVFTAPCQASHRTSAKPTTCRSYFVHIPKAVGGGVIEMRVFVGQGYRVYFTIRDAEIILLLCGGNKSSQQRDIEKAKNLRNQL